MVERLFTRVNVWTVRLKKMTVVERWPLVEVRLYAENGFVEF